jgi:hypothetical protein
MTRSKHATWTSGMTRIRRIPSSTAAQIGAAPDERLVAHCNSPPRRPLKVKAVVRATRHRRLVLSERGHAVAADLVAAFRGEQRPHRSVRRGLVSGIAVVSLAERIWPLSGLVLAVVRMPASGPASLSSVRLRCQPGRPRCSVDDACRSARSHAAAIESREQPPAEICCRRGGGASRWLSRGCEAPALIASSTRSGAGPPAPRRPERLRCPAVLLQPPGAGVASADDETSDPAPVPTSRPGCSALHCHQPVGKERGSD